MAEQTRIVIVDDHGMVRFGLRGYLERQWRHNAPKKWLKAWDAGTELPPLTGEAPRKRARKTR